MHVPAEWIRATGVLITERDHCHSLVSSPLRPTNDRIHTSSLLPENLTEFSDIILNGDQRARYLLNTLPHPIRTPTKAYHPQHNYTSFGHENYYFIQILGGTEVSTSKSFEFFLSLRRARNENKISSTIFVLLKKQIPLANTL